MVKHVFSERALILTKMDESAYLILISSRNTMLKRILGWKHKMASYHPFAFTSIKKTKKKRKPQMKTQKGILENKLA